MYQLNTMQEQVVAAMGSSFLLGPAGTGKSTALYHRIAALLENGEPASTIIFLVSEFEDIEKGLRRIQEVYRGPFSDLTVTTFSQFCRDTVSLYWPQIALEAGFDDSNKQPVFLGYDLAQLLMSSVVETLIDDGAFADLRLRPQHIISQVLDTLNRASLNGLSLHDAVERQRKSWSGRQEHLQHLADAAEAARRFRDLCLRRGALDLSLTVQVFSDQLVNRDSFRQNFNDQMRHLIVDNVEEQSPAGQAFVRALMASARSSAIAYDSGGGYKRFLAADPAGANQFRGDSQQLFEFDHSFTSSPQLYALAGLVENHLMSTKKATAGSEEAILKLAGGRRRHEMAAAVTGQVRELTQSGLSPSDVAIVAPYLDSDLRSQLVEALEAMDVPYRVQRRRLTPRDEPLVRAWLTWLALAHPSWGIRPQPFDVAEALTLCIAGMDPVRAQLATNQLYDAGEPALLPVAGLSARLVERIGWMRLTLIDDLRQWLAENGNGRYAVDVFLHRLFQDLLAQKRYQPEPDLDAAAICDWLISSASRVRQAAPALGLDDHGEVGRALINGIRQGLVAANPPVMGDSRENGGVLLSTVHAFLLSGLSARVQVWLEASGNGWWTIPNQPLSNPFVLAKSWPAGRQWTLEEEHAMRNQLLSRLIRGLCARCSDGVILAYSDIDQRGIYLEGPLWRALQPAVRRVNR